MVALWSRAKLKHTLCAPPVLTRSGFTYGFFFSLAAEVGDFASSSFAMGASAGIATGDGWVSLGVSLEGLSAGFCEVCCGGGEVLSSLILRLSRSRPSEFGVESSGLSDIEGVMLGVITEEGLAEEAETSYRTPEGWPELHADWRRAN